MRFLLTILILIVSAGTCWAQGTLRSEINPGTGHIDDLFLFTVSYEGPQERITPQLSTGGDFEVQLLGPKTSISIVNGQVSSRQQFIYQLTPKREGVLKTPEVQAQVNGQILSAAPISITIKGASQKPADTTDADAKQIFMRQSASPESAYVGQQIVNAITVFTRINLRGVRIEDDAADGFWQETISDGENSQRTVNGVEYGSAQILRALFALKSGELSLPVRRAIVQVPVNKRANPLTSLDPFSDDFFGSFFQRTVVQERTLESNGLTLKIIPLPPVPDDLIKFNRGLTIVGETLATSRYTDTPIKIGESKNLAISIASTGHLNPLKAPTLSVPPGVKIYDGQTNVKHEVVQGKLLTEKTFNYSIVPTQPGVMRIPGVSIAYFDPDKGGYKLITTPDVSLVVTGVPGEIQSSVNPSMNQRATEAPTDNPAKVSSETDPQRTAPILGSSLPYLEKTRWESLKERVSVGLALLALAAAIALFGVLTFLSKIFASKAVQRNALSEILNASSLESLETGVRAWASKSLKGVTPHATFDEIRAAIKQTSTDQATALKLIATLDELELARYANNAAHSLDSLKRGMVEAISGM